MEQKKYYRPPTPKRVDYILKLSGLKIHEFEIFYGVERKALRDAVNRKRTLPKQYWHLFFDPPKPIADKLFAVTKTKSLWSGAAKHTLKKLKKEREEKEPIKKIGVLDKLLS